MRDRVERAKVDFREGCSTDADTVKEAAAVLEVLKKG